MSVSPSPVFLTSSFLSCAPYPTVTATVTSTFVKEYCVTLPAACSTSEWMATYTITETCTGDESKWTTPAMPANFVVTTVTCDVCANPTQTITCPNALGTGPAVVAGNGVTATVAPTAAAAAMPAGASTMSTAIVNPTGAAMSPTMVGAYQTAAAYQTAGAPRGLSMSGLAMAATAATVFLGAVLA